MAKINIYKRIHGSLTNKKGDGVLGYTEDYSDRTKLVSSVIDNPPVLSPNYATVIWRYYKNTDRYMYIHIQGSRFMFSDRNYPYRAAFEVNRKDMLSLAKDYLPMECVVEKMPQMKTEYTEDTFKNLGIEETVTVNKAAPTPQSEALATAIMQAIVDQKRLCISIGSLGTSCKDNGVLDNGCFKAMVAAIESLPKGIAQYVGFGVCVDDNHARFLDDVMVMFYADEKPFTVPADAKDMSWDDIITKPAKVNKKVFNKLTKLVSGNGSSLLSLAKMMQNLSDAYKNYESICKKNALKVKGNEWEIWLLEHSVQDITLGSWEDFNTLCDNMPLNLEKELVGLCQKASLNWPLNEGLMMSLVGRMNYSPEEKSKLQEKALQEYLASKCNKYAFLYDEDFNFSKVLDSRYLKNLKLTKLTDIKEWYQNYKKHNCLGDSEKKEFLKLFKSVRISELKKAVNMLIFLNNENLGVVSLTKLSLDTEAMKLKDYTDLQLLDKKEMKKKGLTTEQYEEVNEFIEHLAKDFMELNYSVELLEDLTKRDKSETKNQKEYFLRCLESDENGILKMIFDKGKKANFIEICNRMLTCRENLDKYKDKYKELNDKIQELVGKEIKANYFKQFNEDKFRKLCNDFFNADKKSEYKLVCSLVYSLFKEEARKVDDEDLTKLVDLTISEKNSEIASILYDILKEKSQKDDSESVKANLEKLTSNFEGISKKHQKVDFSDWKSILHMFFSNRKNVWIVAAGVLLVVIVIAVLCCFFCSGNAESEDPKQETPKKELVPNDTIDTTNDSVNIMLKLAEHIDDTVAVKLKDTLCVIGISDSTLTKELWIIDSLYLQQNKGMFTDVLEDVEMSKGELRNNKWIRLNMQLGVRVTEQEPLLKSVCQECLRINSFYSGGSISIESNDSIMENNTYYAKYYLQTIKVINDSIKNGKNKIAY